MIDMTEKKLTASNAPNVLDTLSQPIEIRDIWFNGKDVYLDGFSFVSCRFDKCHLTVSSENFEMHDCFIDKDTTVTYRGKIIRILRLFNREYSWVRKYMPKFAPLKNDDETITII